MSDRQLIADLLSALEYHTEQTRPIEFSRVAIEAAREYLRKPAQKQEPVGYVYSVHGERIKNACIESDVPNGTPLYILPQRKPWVGLTDAEIARVVSLAGFAPDWAEANIATQIVRVCQDILKEKNA